MTVVPSRRPSFDHYSLDQVAKVFMPKPNPPLPPRSSFFLRWLGIFCLFLCLRPRGDNRPLRSTLRLGRTDQRSNRREGGKGTADGSCIQEVHVHPSLSVPRHGDSKGLRRCTVHEHGTLRPDYVPSFVPRTRLSLR